MYNIFRKSTTFEAMKFRTEIDIKPLKERMGYSSEIITMGSCFAGEVGGRLHSSKFRITVNPSGVLFNPASICRTAQRFATCRLVTAEELHEGREGWCHYDFHSSLNSASKELCVKQINDAIVRGHHALERADWVVLTLGTAWIYELKSSGEVVASCHKQPHSIFHRRRLSVPEIVDRAVATIEQYMPNKRVILTLSPIRHVGDGLDENCLSKSTLRVAIDEICSRRPTMTHYFPAYEILMDDLRDYRFYGEDMVHPASVAVEYVWQRFIEFAISSNSLPVMERVEKIMRASKHRPLNSESTTWREFCAQQLAKIAELDDIVDLESERRYFQESML